MSACVCLTVKQYCQPQPISVAISVFNRHRDGGKDSWRRRHWRRYVKQEHDGQRRRWWVDWRRVCDGCCQCRLRSLSRWLLLEALPLEVSLLGSVCRHSTGTEMVDVPLLRQDIGRPSLLRVVHYLLDNGQQHIASQFHSVICCVTNSLPGPVNNQLRFNNTFTNWLILSMWTSLSIYRYWAKLFSESHVVVLLRRWKINTTRIKSCCVRRSNRSTRSFRSCLYSRWYSRYQRTACSSISRTPGAGLTSSLSQ